MTPGTGPCGTTIDDAAWRRSSCSSLTVRSIASFASWPNFSAASSREPAPISKIANIEKKLPPGYIRKDGFGITAAARGYFEPLIRGEDPPPYDATSGLPKYARLKRVLVKKKLPAYSIADK